MPLIQQNTPTGTLLTNAWKYVMLVHDLYEPPNNAGNADASWLSKQKLPMPSVQ